MVRKLSRHCLFAFGLGLFPAFVSAQAPNNYGTQPVPVSPQMQQPGAWPPGPAPVYQPGPLPPNNNPVVPATPIFLDDPFRPIIGPNSPLADPACWYGSFEISILFPELHGLLSGPVTVLGFPDTVTLGSAELQGIGSPRVEIGYRLGQEMGAVSVVYRSIVSRGGTNIPAWDFLGEGYLNTRLNVNILDVDYISPAYNFAPFWDFAWRGGIRGAAAYYDNQVIGNFLRQHATNNFLGAGPHATVEFGRALDLLPGLAFVTKLDGAVLFGNVSQSFEETIHIPAGPTFGDTTRFNQSRVVPVVTFDLGLSYTPPGAPNWARFGFGYQHQYWWDLGTRGSSRGDLGINGLYFRGEFNF